MKINASDKLIAYLTLLSGLSISAVAVYYSVAGLVSIFAAAAIPIMIMGVALEVSKLVATVWLKLNWSLAPRLIKTYLIIAITILMLITSMGIFGFLSKAHLDQAVPTGDVADKVALIDEKISTQKENINAARKALKQMDESVDQVMARSSDEKGADKAAALRRGQQKERAQLQGDIAKAQKEISALNEERAPIAKELRKVEAEVGPIKYIAALLYGDNPDQNILEKAVRWVIIIIVMVFDPLAVILLLASQYSFMWFRQREEDEAAMAISAEPIPGVEERPFTEEEVTALEQPEEVTKERFAPLADKFWPFPAKEVKETPVEPGQDDIVDDIVEAAGGVEAWNKMIADAEKAIDEENKQEHDLDIPVLENEETWAQRVIDEHDEMDSEDEAEKEAMRRWKAENPGETVKHQRNLFENGIIKELPWTQYLKAEADFTDDEAAEEAAKWAMEQLEKKEQSGLDERPGDYLPENQVSWMEHDENGNQVIKSGYQQNAEQNNSTIWQRIQNKKDGQ